jgi:hypothetical protein
MKDRMNLEFEFGDEVGDVGVALPPVLQILLVNSKIRRSIEEANHLSS